MKILGTETAREPNHTAHAIELACELIRHLDHEAIFVRTIYEALEQAKQENFDYILIHHMDFNGVRALRKISPNSKYIGFSGNTFPGTSRNSIGYEFRERMLQDYNIVASPKDLVDKIKEIFEQKQPQ